VILESGAWLVSGILFFINLFILNRKNKSIVAQYVLWHITITTIIISVFFPIPYQKELIEDKAYIEKTQTFVLFRDIREIISHVTEDKWGILRQYLKEYALVSISIGCAFSFSLRLTCENKIRWLEGCILFSIGMQLLKFIICRMLHAQYLSITIDDVVYIILGCLIGSLAVKFMRFLCVDMKTKNSLEKIIVDLLLKNQ